MRKVAISLFLLLVLPASTLAACPSEPVVKVTKDLHLDPSCRYGSEFRITASNVTLDCHGAVLDGRRQTGFGVRVDSEGKGLRNVTIQNCRIRNFRFGGVWIGWDQGDRQKRELTADISEMYRRSPGAVRIIGSQIVGSGNAGIYVDDYSSAVTIALSAVLQSGSVGIYLEHSSRGNRVLFNSIEGNGTRSPREGLAIDSSAGNLVLGNTFLNNKAGGVFLYKNCYERHSSDSRAVRRWQFSDRNVIAGNVFDESGIGVWIASRQSRDLSRWDCGDAPIVDKRIYRDYARNNLVTLNRFRRSRVGVRVEDDRNKVIHNLFEDDRNAQPIVVGSRYLEDAGRPLRGVTIRDNYRLRGSVKEPILAIEAQR